MDLMRARVALRERPLLDVLDLAVRFCAAHARAYAKMALAVIVPAFGASWAAGRLVGWWMGWTVAVVLSAFAGAPFIALASRLVFAESVGTREALRVALRALPGLVAVRLLQLMALAASLFALGLPWFWLGTILLFVVEVAVLEQTGVGAVLGRTQRIAHANFMSAAFTMILGASAPIGAAMLADVAGREVLASVLEIKPPPSMFHEGGSWLALLGWWATLPLLETARFFVYLDIRTRTEGWDIQTRFAAISAREEEQEQETQKVRIAGDGRAARRTVAAVMALLCLVTVLRPAHAALDPARAQADTDAAMHEGAYTFCREPRTPLSPQARALCPHATKIPDCAGFASECAKVTTPPAVPSWSWLRWLPHWLSLPGFVGSLAQIVIWVLVAALVIAVLVPIVSAIVRIRRERAPKDSEAPPAPREEAPRIEVPNVTDPQLLLSRADQLARAGHWGSALQMYLLASLRALDQRGAVRIAKDRTNGEYVRACADAGAKPALRDIVREVDRVQFGGQEATADCVTRAAQQAVAIVRAIPVATAVVALALVGALGCGGGSVKLPRPGDDPAGTQLFRDVLRRQGMHLAGLDSALASLALPGAGERAPAVLVDVEKTGIDDDTRDHLVEWVEAGGVLVLAGNPFEWPKEFGGAGAGSAAASDKITVRRLLARSPAAGADEDEEEKEQSDEDAIYAPSNEVGALASGAGLTFAGTAERAAWFDDGTLYAAVLPHGSGYVLGIASDELMTNAGLARPGNAAAMVSILSNADRLEIRMADPEDGVSPPTTPIAALLRAGLGTALVHALVATLILFLAAGVRLARPKPAYPPRRRAFAEHVQAVGALYARARSAPHALGAFARFADERLRARLPRGSSDVPGFLASRASLPLDVCQRLWGRALHAKAGAPPLGDELVVLRDLTAAYAAAMNDNQRASAGR
jgi:hypothetical protein